jgi:DNA repair exonuclease SbcCD ATPase subunit
VERTVTAALVDATARAALQRGQLESELASPGFDVFGGAHPVESRRRRGRVPVTPTRPTAARRAHVPPALREAREERRRRRLEPLETAVQKVQEQLAAAQAQVPEAETRLASLLGDVRQAREDLKRRRAEGRKLEQAVRRARRALDAARRRKE